MKMKELFEGMRCIYEARLVLFIVLTRMRRSQRLLMFHDENDVFNIRRASCRKWRSTQPYCSIQKK